MTLRWRLALILAAVALAVGAFAATAAYVTTAGQLRSGIDDTLRSRAAAVNAGPSGRSDGHDGVEASDDERPDPTGCPTPGSFQPASAAQLVSTTGAVSSCIEGGVRLPVTSADRALTGHALRLRTVTIDGDRYRLLSTPWRGGGLLEVARSLHEADSLLDGLRLRLAALVAAATTVAAALGWLIATRVARPIVRLRDRTQAIASTLDLSTPIDVTATGEVGDLATSFAAMVVALDRSKEQQRRLVADASHEMRTPLTSLRSNVELLQQISRLPADERREVVADVLEDVDELSHLLGELVDLASDLASAEPEEDVDLSVVSRTVADRTQRRSDRPVLVTERGPAWVRGRPRQLERAISNLVDNAVKYSAEGTPIEVVVDGSTVTVLDRGRGIAPDDLPHVFDRFYRAVDVRTETGSGLGLSIVDEVVRGHGGQVFARNRDGGGSEIGFTLPGDLEAGG